MADEGRTRPKQKGQSDPSFLPPTDGRTEDRAEVRASPMLEGQSPLHCTGGLPHISFEPRKPADVTAMIKSGVEAITGTCIMANADLGQADHQPVRPTPEGTAGPHRI